MAAAFLRRPMAATPWEPEPELRSGFERDGFVIVRRPVVPADQLADLRDRLDALHRRAASLGPRFAGDLGPVRHHDGPPAISEVLRARLHDPELQRHPAVRTLADLARFVLDRRVWSPYDHSIYKPPGEATEVAWHQDAAYDGAPWRAPAIHLWLALDDVDPEQGGMRYSAGSHLAGLHEHHPAHAGGLGHQLRAQADPVPTDVGPLPAGAVVGHHPLTLHSSLPNTSTVLRRSWILHFQATRSRRSAHQVAAKATGKVRRITGGPPALD